MNLTSDIIEQLPSDTLYSLHTGLFRIITNIHAQMLNADGTPLIPTMSERWEELDARHADISRTMRVISGVLLARESAKVAASA